MSNLFDAHFTFNTTGSMSSSDNFKAYLDNDGNIIDNSQLDYGYHHIPISINISKLFIIKRHTLGLGDIIDFFTKKLYIKDLIVYLTKGNCGCEERRIVFNKWFKFVWFTFTIRSLYLQDHEMINRLKNFKKYNIKLPTEDKKTERKLPTRSEVAQNGVTNVPSSIQKPVTKEQVKRSCGCANKKK